MKKLLYAIAGFCWGIFIFNKEILWYAIVVSVVAISTDLLTDTK